MLLFPLRGSGSGVYVDKLANGLARRGHSVNVLCCGHTIPCRSYATSALLFRDDDGENETFDLDFNFPTFTTHPFSQETTFGTLTTAQRRTYLQAFRAKIIREVTAFDPDLIHVHHGWVIGHIVADLGIPYLVTLHGTEHLGFERYPDYQHMMLHGLREARLVVALTEEDRARAIAAYRLPPERVVVVSSGVDTEFFRPLDVDKAGLLKAYGIHRAERPVVLFGGKLTAIKGVDVLLRAAVRYSRLDRSPLTLIAGDGDARISLQAMAGELGLEAVHFLSHQSQAQMVRLYNVADVVVIPSFSESFPMVALEALACGTPVVASDVGGIRRVVVERTGYLVPPGDPVELGEKIVASLQGQFKERVGAIAVDHIQRHYRWSYTVDRVEAEYRQSVSDALT